MANCTYTFTGADGKSIVLKGIPALKEFLLEGGLQKFAPARAAELAAGNKADLDGQVDPGVSFSLREKPDPKKTVIAYKLFRVEKDRPGELFPLFVPVWGKNGPQKYSARDPRRHGEGLPVGEWYDAEVGENAPATKTGKPQVKSKLGGLAFRPGWHAGDLPIATHIGSKSDPALNAPDQRSVNHVWAEVEMPNDVDWQVEADKRGVNKSGKFIAKEAHITDQIPEDGFYRYKTNSNMTGNWMIGGSMKVTRILSDDEVKAINDAAGTADLPRAKPFDAEAYGFAKSARQGEDLGDRLKQRIFSDFDAAVSEYSSLPGTKNGKLLDTDQARELSAEYRADRSLAPLVHNAASAFTQRAFEERMANAPDGALVVFMAGGGGAGKSSAEHLLSSEMDRANTILDGTLSSYDKAARNVKLALDNNQTVRITYVYREPVDALANQKGSVLERAMSRGRTVTLDAVVKGHAGSSEVVRKLQETFGDNPNFKINVIDNSHGPEGAVFSTLDDVPVVSREGLLEKFKDATDKALADGWISQKVYDATTSSYDTRETNGSKGERAGVRSGTQSQGAGRGETGRTENAVSLSVDAPKQQTYLQAVAKESGYKNIDEFADKDYPAFIAAAAQWRGQNPAELMFSRKQQGKETESWTISRNEAGYARFGAGAKAYRAVADLTNTLLDKIRLKPMSPELSLAMRKMKVEVDRARNMTVDVVGKMQELSKDERQMVSDVIEGELMVGVKPPKHILELATAISEIMTEQSDELVRLGMISEKAAGRWEGKYLPRFYEQTLKSEAKGWAKAARNLVMPQRTMQGISGGSLKGRGQFQTINVEDLNDWIAEGWEVRDENFDSSKHDVITVWRDYSREEREGMGEIRDAMFRFAMGYMRSQRDIALGNLYKTLAKDFASRTEKEGYVQVPKSAIEDTVAKRYGALAGMWVPAEVMDHLVATDESMQSGLMKLYRSGLSKWKEGKTVLNPVAHANNVISNLTMAHFAGVSYWDGQKYLGALKDLVTNADMVQEGKDAGLFGGTFNQSELVDMLPDELKELAGKTESAAGRAGNMAWNIASLGLRKPLAIAYEAEDLFFRYLIYRDARERGVDVDDAVTYAQKFIFTYDDLPKGARMIRDAPIGIPFISWTYKAIPVLAQTAAEFPWRFAAPATVVMGANAMMYAIAAGASEGGDDDWWELMKRYVLDEDFREKARLLEKEERANLPEWQKGLSIFGTAKVVRLGMDDVTGLPVFLDISRIFPGGDMGDFNSNTGGLPLPAWLTPNSPAISALSAYITNRDLFTGKDVVDKDLDTDSEKAAKWGEWAYKQVMPAIAPFNYHFDRTMNALANSTGKDIDLYFREYTGTDKMGQPVQAKYAAMQTVGVKARPVDLDVAQQINASKRNAQIREIEKQMRAVQRGNARGFYTDERSEVLLDRLDEKKQNLKEGLTVGGKEPK